MKTFMFRAAGVLAITLTVLPGLALAQSYDNEMAEGTCNDEMNEVMVCGGSTPSYYPTSAYSYNSSYGYGTSYPYGAYAPASTSYYPSSYSYPSAYITPSIYISTGGDVYGGDYIPTINGSDPAYYGGSGYGYGYIPTMGTYTPSYNYGMQYPYGYNSQPYAYGYNPNQYGYNYNPGYGGYAGSPSYYNSPSNYGGASGCSSTIGGVCGQDTSIGLGAAIYRTLLPYNYTTGL